ncbi:unnamed protein product, partial [Closterium sp. NIES-64]
CEQAVLRTLPLLLPPTLLLSLLLTHHSSSRNSLPRLWSYSSPMCSLQCPLALCSPAWNGSACNGDSCSVPGSFCLCCCI